MINFSAWRIFPGLECLIGFFPSKQEAIDAIRAERRTDRYGKYEVEASYIGEALFTREIIR